MFKKLTTESDVVLDPSTSPAREGKPISVITEVSFRESGKVHIVGKYEGGSNFNYPFTRDELPTDEAKTLFDNVVTAVNALHESQRKADANYGTSAWIEYVEQDA